MHYEYVEIRHIGHAGIAWSTQRKTTESPEEDSRHTHVAPKRSPRNRLWQEIVKNVKLEKTSKRRQNNNHNHNNHWSLLVELPETLAVSVNSCQR